MRKFGRILFCFVPFLFALGIQFILSIPFTGIAFLRVFNGSLIYDSNALTDALMEAISSTSFTISLSLAYGICALVIFFIWYQKRFSQPRLNAAKHYINLPILISLVCLVVGMQHLTSYIASLVATIHPAWLEHYMKLMETAGFSEINLPLVLYAVLIGPISEELIYRGVTLGYAKKEMPFWVANILQAFMFGVFHMNVIQGVYAFFIGLIFGYICHKGSIYLAILLHILFNIWGTFIQNSHMSNMDTAFFFFFWLSLGIAFTVAGIVIFRLGIQKLAFRAKDFGISSDN